uniref:Bowman-Birk serine protease inhibitors family domain-containing protein n=1 Tax=Oryza meridionalis TaxID=40149 RepID=A0A0E0FBX7_9ORYZ
MGTASHASGATSPTAAAIAAVCAVLVLSSSVAPAAAKMFCGSCDDICTASCIYADTIPRACAPQCDGCSPEACQSCLQDLRQECLTSCGDSCRKNCT